MERQFETPGFYFQWHFLEACNLKCRHCYQKGVARCFSNREIIDEVLVQINRALATWNVFGRVSLTGGEPFLEKETLGYILKHLETQNRISHIGILTNGTLLDRDAISMLKRCPKLHEVQISFDGVSPPTHDAIRGEGAFSRALSGLRMLVDNDIPSSVMFTATKVNMGEAASMIDFAKNERASAITIERYTPVNGIQDPLALTADETHALFESVFRAKKTASGIRVRTSRPLWALLDENIGGICPVGYSCLTIMHDGTLFPCRRLPIQLGNVMTDGIFKVWYSSPILRRLRRREDIPSCSGCPHESSCGGCRAAAFATTGDFMSTDPLCWKEKK